MLANSPFVFVAAPSLKADTFQDFVRMAKARPGEISFASGGIGNSTHLAMELVAQRTGVRLQHVPFNGSGGSTSLMNGQTPVMMNVLAGVQPYIAGKKLVPLAVTGDKRQPALPAVPTFKELGYDVQVPGGTRSWPAQARLRALSARSMPTSTRSWTTRNSRRSLPSSSWMPSRGRRPRWSAI